MKNVKFNVAKVKKTTLFYGNDPFSLQKIKE